MSGEIRKEKKRRREAPFTPLWRNSQCRNGRRRALPLSFPHLGGMPPKKKAKSNALAVREDVISSLDPSTTGPHELTLDHLARAYGLKSDDGGPARPCPPKATSGKDTTEGRKKSEPEVIVLDSTDEDDEPVVVPGKRPAGKGKGKDKDGCSSENCSSNARCLNWMSQDKWEEDSGQSGAPR